MNAASLSQTTAPLWQPDAQRVNDARITHFTKWIEQRSGLRFPDYATLWRWSTDEPDAFWLAVWDYFQIVSPDTPHIALASAQMPGAQWFPHTRVNLTAQVFKQGNVDHPAIVYTDETGEVFQYSWERLEHDVASLARALMSLGVSRGDRVAAWLPNRPEAVVAFLACASLGAIWSLCSPDMGALAVLDRFGQIEPKVLFACDGYRYGGKPHPRLDVLEELAAGLPTLTQVVVVPTLRPGLSRDDLPASLARAELWPELISGDVVLEPVWVDFQHPLWIVYSSGTTGMPKPIVHGHGGIILAMSTMLALHNDLGPQDRYHWYSSTSWIMWNCQVGGLLVGSTICLYDGNPGTPDLGALWRFAEKAGITFFGAGAAYYASCEKAGISPDEIADLSTLRSVGSTGSPLSPESYAWIYRHVGHGRIWLTPMSGGTDLAGPFIAGNPTMPVYRGQMQCRVLGAAVHAFNDAGKAVIDEVGELVCTTPMPSMPVFFWNDPNDQRYLDSYFDTWPGVWRHGDWIRITPSGGAIIYGRSDATINRHGIRMGTAELYRAVEALPQIVDSMVVDLEYLGKPSYMPLFVVLGDGIELDGDLTDMIKARIRSALTARHVPNDIFVVPDIPRTLSGKKLELPIKKLLLGQPLDKVINRGSMANPDVLKWYLAFADAYLLKTAPTG